MNPHGPEIWLQSSWITVACHYTQHYTTFSNKKYMCARPSFRTNNVWKWGSWYKNDNCQFVALIMKRFHMFTHFYTASFSIGFLWKQQRFFTWSTRCVLTKLWAVSESSLKIKVRLHWTLFVILLQQLFENEDVLYGLCNTFKTANAITLAKTVLVSPYKVMQVSWKGTIFKQPVQFSKAFQFL